MGQTSQGSITSARRSLREN